MDNKKKDTHDIRNLATIGIGTKAGVTGLQRASGQTVLYHGTSSANWDKIKNEGLKADKGGVGGTIEGMGLPDDFVRANGHNKVYATKSKVIANTYAVQGELGTKMQGMSDAEKAKAGRNVLFSPGNGKRINILMNYGKWDKGFEVDPDVGSIVSDAAGRVLPKNMANNMGKSTAARTTQNINTDEIMGSTASAASKIKRVAKYLPEYYKEYPIRGLSGVGLAAAGVGLARYGVKGLYNEHKKEARVSFEYMVQDYNSKYGDA